MYAGILFGTIVLAGCDGNEELTEGLTDDSKIVELPPLEPEKLSYEEIVIENPSIANLKTYEQVEEYYNLNGKTVTEVPKGVFPQELNSVQEAIEYFEAQKRYQENNK